MVNSRNSNIETMFLLSNSSRSGAVLTYRTFFDDGNVLHVSYPL